MAFMATKTSFGSLLGSGTKKIGGFIDQNLGDGLSTLGKGLSSIGRNVIDEAFGSKGLNKNSIYDSPYPLGNEWVVDPAYTVTIAFTDPNTGSLATVQGYMPDTISMGLSADYASPLEGVGEALSGAGGPVSFVAKLMGNKISSNIFSVVLWSGSSHMDLTLELRFVALTDSYKDVIEPIRKLTSLITPTIESFSATNGAVQLGFMKSPGPSFTYAGDTSVLNTAGYVAGTVANAVGDLGNAVTDAVTNVSNGNQTAMQGVISAGGASIEALGGAFNNIVKDIVVKNNISVKLGEFALLRSVVVKDVTSAYNIKADAQGNWTDATVSVQIGTFVSPTNLDIPDMIGYKTGADGVQQGSDVAVSGLDDVASDVFKKAGVNKVPTLTGMLGKIGATVTTASKDVREYLFNNTSKLGKDAGLGTKLMDTVYDKSKAPSAPGMSDIDKLEYKAQLYNV